MIAEISVVTVIDSNNCGVVNLICCSAFFVVGEGNSADPRTGGVTVGTKVNGEVESTFEAAGVGKKENWTSGVFETTAAVTAGLISTISEDFAVWSDLQ